MTSERALARLVNENDSNGYYRSLGVSPGATRNEIKVAYRRLIRKLHPDLGGNEELYRFVVEVANVLLSPKKKKLYDSIGDSFIYLGDMEREELARVGVHIDEEDKQPIRAEAVVEERHWACLTTSGFSPGKDTDAWIDFCRQVSPAIGYCGKIRVGVVDGGHYWPGDRARAWGIFNARSHTFVIFQRGVEPSRLHALCAMIDWQKHLLNQRNGLGPEQRREQRGCRS